MRLLIALLLLVCVAAPARADKASAEKAYNEGLALYKASEFRGAADKFQLAYERDPDPVYLFNLAQAYRFAKMCRESADSYTRFLKEAPNAPNKDKVEKYLDEMTACAHSQEPVKSKSEPKVEPKAEPNPEPAPKLPPSNRLEDPAASEPADVPPRDTGTRPARSGDRRTLGYALAGVGVAGLVTGALFHHEVSVLNSNHCHDAQPPSGCTPSYVDDLNSRGDTAEYAAIASYSIGAAALAAGIWLVVHGHADEHALAVAPTRGGATLSFSF